MKRYLLTMIMAGMACLASGGWSWAQDAGIPDTFYVEIYPDDQVQTGGPPYSVRFPIYVTHDIIDPVYDSIAAIVASLCYEHTNPSKYCSASSYWNNVNVYPGPDLDRSIFRHFIQGGDTLIHNWMMDLSQQQMGLEWSFRFVSLDGSSTLWLSLVPTGSQDQAMGEGSRILLNTFTFKLEDTTTICIDTCFWPPSYLPLDFANECAETYHPQHFLPACQSIRLAPKTVYVDYDNTAGPWDGTPEYPYQHIQDGVDNANSDDTVYVFGGVYYENVEVNKQILLVGENKENATIDAGGEGSCLHITADSVTVTGFTVRNSGGISFGVGGIQISSSYCKVTSNIAKENAFHGIMIFGEYGDRHDNIVSHNIVSDNNWTGILVSRFGDEAYDNVISDNLITGNTYFGIDLNGDHGTIVSGNTIQDNEYGIAATEPFSYGARISGNTISGNDYGIYNDAWSGFGDATISDNTISDNALGGLYIKTWEDDTVAQNVVSGNGGSGIFIWTGQGTVIANNIISGNSEDGITLSADLNHIFGNYIDHNLRGVNLNGHDNLVYENTVVSNTEYGLYVGYAWNDTIYHNDLINNGVNAFNEDISNVNVWDDGYPEGGNCWSDYAGVDSLSGPGQDVPGSDGIGDTPYQIPGGGQDSYPLLSGCMYVRGDANGDGLMTIGDVLYMLNYLFRGGPPPVSFVAGDANCDDDLGIIDPLYLLNYLYRGGSPPVCP